jgi:hypothetical protein
MLKHDIIKEGFLDLGSGDIASLAYPGRIIILIPDVLHGEVGQDIGELSCFTSISV